MAFSPKNYHQSGFRAGGGADILEAACPPTSGMWHGFQPLGLLTGRVLGQGWLPYGDASSLENWVVTLVEAGAGESTLTVTNAHPPRLLVTTDAAESDGVNAQYGIITDVEAKTTYVVHEPFKYTAGHNIYFEARFQTNDSTQSKGEFGLIITDTTINGGVSDGIYFRKKDGDQTLFFVLEKNSTETETELTTALGSTELADDTDITIGFRVNCGATAATSSVDVFVNGRKVAVAPAMTNFCDDEELALSFCWHTGEANACTLSFSHIVAYQEAI